MRALPGWIDVFVNSLQFALTGLFFTRIAWSVRVVGIVLFLLCVLAAFVATIFTYTSLTSMFHVKGHLLSLLQSRISHPLASSITILVWISSTLFMALLASILSETTTILLAEVQVPHTDNIVVFAAISTVFILIVFCFALVRHNYSFKIFAVTLLFSVIGLLFMTYQIVYSIMLQNKMISLNVSVLKYAFFSRFTLSVPVVGALILPSFSFILHNTSNHSKSSYKSGTWLVLFLLFVVFVALGLGEQLLLSLERGTNITDQKHSISPVHTSMSPFTIIIIYIASMAAIYRTFLFADETLKSVATCFPYSSILTDLYSPYAFTYTAVISSLFAIFVVEVHSLALWTSSFLICIYTLINWSTYNNRNTVCGKLRSLTGCFFCASLSLIVGWQYAIIPAVVFAIVFAYLDSKAADSIMTTPVSTYTSTVQSLHQLEEGGGLEMFCPQILLLTGNPAARPALVDFANNITKGKSLLICGYVIPQSPTDRTYLMMQKVDKQMTEWLRKRKVHAFGVTVAHQKKSDGSITLLQTAGIGQLRPNILMLGFKTDWDKVVKHNPDAIRSYYDVVLSGFEKNVGVVILRNSIAGFDVSFMMTQSGEHETTIDDLERARTMSSPASPRKASIGDGIKIFTSVIRKQSKFLFTSESAESSEPQDNSSSKKRFEVISKHSVVATPSEHLMVQLHRYRTPIQRAVIDVWWLRDDGGLTLLLPYLLSLKGSYLEGAHLRIFTQSDGSQTQVGTYHKNMAAFLQKLHFDCSDLHILNEFNDEPAKETSEQFDSLVDELVHHDEKYNRGLITTDLLKRYEHKTRLYLRTSELIRERSSQASLIVLTLPRPHRDITGALYLSWLEVLSRELPPVLFVRGNGQKIVPHI